MALAASCKEHPTYPICVQVKTLEDFLHADEMDTRLHYVTATSKPGSEPSRVGHASIQQTIDGETDWINSTKAGLAFA